jgi:F-type H+-transporting ATPase subunit a
MGKMMARLSRRKKIVIIALLAIVLVAVGRLYFPTPVPHVELAPERLWSVGAFPITNTMISAWLTIVVLGVIFYLGTRKMQMVPRGLQNVLEAVVEAGANFCDNVAGSEYGRKFFPVVATIFLFIITNAWLSLLPGFASIGFWQEVEGHTVLTPLFRGANTDVNVPLALALLSFVVVEYWGVRAHGFWRYMRKFFNLKKLLNGMGQVMRGRVKSGMGMLFTGFIEAFVGMIELVSELVRIVSFTFRLFGNMTAGEILIFSMLFIIPWVVGVLFYGLEILVGFVQALIFCGLTLVFLAMAVAPHEEH